MKKSVWNGLVFHTSTIITMFINMQLVSVLATALSKQILEEGEPAVKRYLEVPESGSSDYPIEVTQKRPASI